MQLDLLQPTPSLPILRRLLPFRQLSSLSARLLVTCMVALALTLALVATIIVYVFEQYPSATLGRHVEWRRAQQVAAGVQFGASGQPARVTLSPEAQILFSSFPLDSGYRIVNAQGKPVLVSSRSAVPFIGQNAAFSPDASVRIVRDDQVFHVVTAPIDDPSHRHSGEYFAQVSSSESFEAMNVGNKLASVPSVIRITLLLTVVMFGLTMRFTLRSMLKPLHDVSRAAAQISPRNLATRLSLEGIPSELRPLIHAFNAALSRLEQGYVAQQTFLAAAAHELQTPLTLIRGQIEIQETLEGKGRLLQDVDLMARQVRQLLHLTELSESQNYVFMPTRLAELIGDVVQYLERLATTRGVTVATQITAAGLTVLADKSALFILLKNLLENALSVAPPGTIVTVSASEGLITVEDEGPGITPSLIPFIFDRFWRAPDARYEGAGLGLAICKEIATAHDWQIAVMGRPRGTCFQLSYATCPAPVVTAT